jgi:hypothetical protein
MLDMTAALDIHGASRTEAIDLSLLGQSKVVAPEHAAGTPWPDGRRTMTALTKTTNIPTLFLQLGFGLLIGVVSQYCLGAALLIAGLALTRYLSLAVIITSTIISVIAVYVYSSRNFPLVILLLILFSFISLGIAMLLIDTSIDGQEYHFHAVYALAHGWNPYHGTYHITSKLDFFPENQWTIFYPKASWIVSAIDYSAGWPLEAAKGQTTTLLLASFFSALGLLLELGYSRISAAMVSIAAAANPITLTQLFTRMVDGLLATTILLFVVFMIDWIRSKRLMPLIGVSATIIFAINLKFTAIPFFGLFCAFACLAWYKDSGAVSATFAALIFFGVGAVATFVFGYAPYVDNLINHGHPFYPIMGHDAIDIMEGLENTPQIFYGMSKAGRFAFSLFAETHSGYATEPFLKIPYSVSWSGLRYAGNPDARIAGFGPLYSGALVTALAAVFRLLTLRDWDKKMAYPALIVAAAVLSVVFFPENWWARYVPQLWLVPAIIAAVAISRVDRPARALGWVILATMLLNSTAIFATSIWLSVKRDVAVETQITKIQSGGGSFCVFFDSAQARLVQFRKAHVPVTLMRQPMTCPGSEELAGYGPDRTGGQVCSCAAQPTDP